MNLHLSVPERDANISQPIYHFTYMRRRAAETSKRLKTLTRNWAARGVRQFSCGRPSAAVIEARAAILNPSSTGVPNARKRAAPFERARS